MGLPTFPSMNHSNRLRASSWLLGTLVAGLSGAFAACGDYIEPPPLKPVERIDVVIDEDAEAPRAPSPSTSGEPAREPRRADGGAVADASVGEFPIAPALTGGHLYYSFEGSVFRVATTRGAVPENISRALDKLGNRGDDLRITASSDSRWMLLTSSRFGGASSDTLVLVPSDLSRVELIRPEGSPFTPQGVATIVPGAGDLVVYAASTGPHAVDLFSTRRVSGRWLAPKLLTSASTYPYNNMPALTHDGTRVTFDCGQNPYPESGNNDACEVALDGTGFRRIVTSSLLPNARQTHVQNPHEGRDGLYFEAAWPVAGRQVAPEIIWMLPRGSSVPVPKAPSDNAVAPCTLPDGRYAALWLAGPGNTRGDHELTIFGGSSPIVLTPGIDVTDIGIGCGD